MSEETEATEPATADTSEVSTEASQEPAYTVKIDGEEQQVTLEELQKGYQRQSCLLYTSPSPRDRTRSRMPSSA